MQRVKRQALQAFTPAWLSIWLSVLLISCFGGSAQAPAVTTPVLAASPVPPTSTGAPTPIAIATATPVADAENEGTTNDAPDTVVIEFWTTDTEPERITVYQNIALRYMASNPNVAVQIVGVAEDVIVRRLREAAQRDALPDLARIGVERTMTLAADGLVDSDAAQWIIDQIGAEDFRSGLLAMVADPESQAALAVPYDGWFQALWYRRDLFQEFGLEAPVSWDAINLACDSLAAAEPVAYALTLPTASDQTYVHQVFEQFAMSNGVWPYDSNGQLALDSPEMIETLRFYAALERCSPPGVQDLFNARERYEQGQTAALFYSTYIMDDLVEGSDTRDGLGKVEVTVEDLAGRTAFASGMVGPAAVATYGQLATLVLFPEAHPAAQDLALYFLRDGYQEVLAVSPWGKVPVLESAMTRWSSDNPIFANYSPATLGHIANSYTSMRRWILQAEYTPQQRALIGAIEAELLIPQVINAIVVKKSMTPEEGATWLQAQAEALVP